LKGPSIGEEARLASQGLRIISGAWRTLQGIETVNMIRKGRVKRLAKGDSAGQAIFIDMLFGLVAV
jgi:hypothetical protein